MSSWSRADAQVIGCLEVPCAHDSTCKHRTSPVRFPFLSQGLAARSAASRMQHLAVRPTQGDPVLTTSGLPATLITLAIPARSDRSCTSLRADPEARLERARHRELPDRRARGAGREMAGGVGVSRDRDRGHHDGAGRPDAILDGSHRVNPGRIELFGRRPEAGALTLGRRRCLATTLVAGALTLAGCGASFATIGLERRPPGDVELELVGPHAYAGTCGPGRGAEDPSTHAALDERCSTVSTSHRR